MLYILIINDFRTWDSCSKIETKTEYAKPLYDHGNTIPRFFFQCRPVPPKSLDILRGPVLGLFLISKFCNSKTRLVKFTVLHLGITICPGCPLDILGSGIYDFTKTKPTSCENLVHYQGADDQTKPILGCDNTDVNYVVPFSKLSLTALKILPSFFHVKKWKEM